MKECQLVRVTVGKDTPIKASSKNKAREARSLLDSSTQECLSADDFTEFTKDRESGVYHDFFYHLCTSLIN